MLSNDDFLLPSSPKYNDEQVLNRRFSPLKTHWLLIFFTIFFALYAMICIIPDKIMPIKIHFNVKAGTHSIVYFFGLIILNLLKKRNLNLKITGFLKRYEHLKKISESFESILTFFNSFILFFVGFEEILYEFQPFSDYIKREIFYSVIIIIECIFLIVLTVRYCLSIHQYNSLSPRPDLKSIEGNMSEKESLEEICSRQADKIGYQKDHMRKLYAHITALRAEIIDLQRNLELASISYTTDPAQMNSPLFGTGYTINNNISHNEQENLVGTPENVRHSKKQRILDGYK
eukprot:TRINITY_DN909_c0_g1_i1.p1 TRINITY_DN909_c0_g1~~TRINITY_DN909_c0_g1_i1.p1  ORF type:complete len:289 (-),score=71.93 TRINITY_DN909_c0_g1_i1:111-977(-)